MNDGQQNKHIEGERNYENLVKGGSTPSIPTDPGPQGLLDAGAHTGTQVGNMGIPVGQPGSKEVVDFGKIIGIWKDLNGNSAPTTKGMIHYSSRGAHIIPARP